MRAFITRGRSTIVLAVAGVAVVLGGTATAATLYTSEQIKDDSLYSRDIRNGTLTGSDVKDAALTPADYNGPVVGPMGPTGPQGPQGRPGVHGVEYRTGDGVTLDPRQYISFGLVATCPGETRALSGGLASTDPSAARLLGSAPLDSGTGWEAEVRNEGSARIGVYPWVVCARA
jgi:hypothetical protein